MLEGKMKGKEILEEVMLGIAITESTRLLLD